jgi:hypothetical protein
VPTITLPLGVSIEAPVNDLSPLSQAPPVTTATAETAAEKAKPLTKPGKKLDKEGWLLELASSMQDDQDLITNLLAEVLAMVVDLGQDGRAITEHALHRVQSSREDHHRSHSQREISRGTTQKSRASTATAALPKKRRSTKSKLKRSSIATILEYQNVHSAAAAATSSERETTTTGSLSASPEKEREREKRRKRTLKKAEEADSASSSSSGEMWSVGVSSENATGDRDKDKSDATTTTTTTTTSGGGGGGVSWKAGSSRLLSKIKKKHAQPAIELATSDSNRSAEDRTSEESIDDASDQEEVHRKHSNARYAPVKLLSEDLEYRALTHAFVWVA